MRAAAALLLLAAALPAPVSASVDTDKTKLLIAIVRRAATARIEARGRVLVAPPKGRRRPLEWKGPVTLRPRIGGLRLEDLRLPSETELIPEGGATIQVGRDRYRGSLILRLDPGQTVTVVERVSMEDYLEGVLPFEMDPGWPLEALKAQAVVARTFAYANRGKYRQQGFDLTADTLSQVYRGMSDVNANVRAAVRQTRGEVLGWKGRLLRVYYHACCGGHTENAAEAWGGDPRDTPPPLRGVRDPWCRTSPYMHWTAYFAWQDLMTAIEQRRNLPGPLKTLKIGRRDVAGYVQDFVASAGRKKVDVDPSDLRLALGASDLKSTKIRRLIVKKHGVEFVGSGSGHGVGLCQWGARVQAEKGRSYEQILSFYFPGSTLSVVEP
ncbi:MAG: SpoIID/LytB domain-containing protein [Elusimicrobia bacterium]|nr:SpoIID/LytB domain-containing protein [Elusimicrobiota bacterium]